MNPGFAAAESCPRFSKERGQDKVQVAVGFDFHASLSQAWLASVDVFFPLSDHISFGLGIFSWRLAAKHQDRFGIDFLIVQGTNAC